MQSRASRVSQFLCMNTLFSMSFPVLAMMTIHIIDLLSHITDGHCRLATKAMIEPPSAFSVSTCLLSNPVVISLNYKRLFHLLRFAVCQSVSVLGILDPPDLLRDMLATPINESTVRGFIVVGFPISSLCRLGFCGLLFLLFRLTASVSVFAFDRGVEHTRRAAGRQPAQDHTPPWPCLLTKS